jgi:hypothetical protein
MNRLTVFVFGVLLAASTLVSAQLSPEASPKPAQSASDAAPKHCYALNYVVKELDGTKVINQRSYVLNTFASNAPGGEWTRLRVGNRVPVFVHSQEKGSSNTVTDFNYIDVGVNIDNRLREAGDALALEVTADISSVAEMPSGVGLPPTVRQIKGTAASLIYPGKPAVVFSADDPGSQHRFELQVTATLVR